MRALDRIAGRTRSMLLETLAVFSGLLLATDLLLQDELEAWLPISGMAMGLWFQRLYVVGHEAAHGHLVPGRTRRLWNDLLGQLALLPILVPINVFRAIHRYHHSANRREAKGSALDVYVVPSGATALRRLLPWLLWYLAVFAGGWFVHGLVSVVLFLLVPPRISRKVSPAFRQWRSRDQLAAALFFAMGLGWHAALWLSMGELFWWWSCGFPLIVFAWVYSVQLYVYHYRTTMGPDVRAHVRSVRAWKLTRWWLLHLPAHATHHRHPTIPWYELEAHDPLYTSPLRDRATSISWSAAVLDQLRGPTIVEREGSSF